MNKYVIFWIYVVIGGIILFKLLTKKDERYKRMIEQILNSDRYKVKNQYGE